MSVGAPTSRDTLLAELAEARRATDALFALVKPEALVERPISERHRLLFYVGHLEAFDWNLLWRDARSRPSKHAAWEQLFAFGIDPVDGQFPTDTPDDWPALDAVKSWSAALRADVDAVVRDAPFEGWLEHGWAVRIALEHRWMHAETLAYLLHRLPHDKKQGRDAVHDVEHPAPQNTLLAIPPGRARLGRPTTERHLGWDNEYGPHEVDVPAFRIQRYPVSNADYLRFIEADGYTRRALWTAEDWAWKESQRVTHPAFWARVEGRWVWKAMFENLPLPPSWPAWVSLAEARAYARWAGRTLPTEAQWHRAAYDAGRAYPWGDEAPRPGHHGNFGFARFEPAPVDAHPHGASVFGVEDLLGNGWEWTRTPFAPFEGFERLPFYPGYSANFFDGKHFVMKGGGPRTALPLLRASFRNWFQPHYPHVHAAFRCVEE